MGRRFAAFADLPVPFDPVWAETSIKEFIGASDKLALALVSDGQVAGMLCAGLVRSPLVPVTVAVEQVLWVNETARGRGVIALVKGYEAWARESAADLISLSSIEPRAGRLFERLGWAFAETNYVKVL